MAPNMQNVKVRLNHKGLGKVWLDDTEIHNVSRVQFDAEAHGITTVTLTIFASVDVEAINADVILGDGNEVSA